MTGPSIDLRWAGAARVGLGAALLLDLLRRAQVARTFFSNEGVLPNHVALLREHTLPTFYMSLSRPGEVAVGLALTAVVYLLFTIGFHTRVCHLLALACLVGLGLRNPLVQAPAEPLLAALLALTVTLPLGRRLSIDALRASLARRHEKSSAELADRESPAVSHRSIAVAVLVATWSLLHVLGCLDTTDASLGYLLHHDALVSGVGRALREPLSLPWVARGVRLALLALALLLLIPRARRLAALLAGLLYGGLALTTELDLFAFVRFLPFVLLLRTPGLAARWFARDSRKRTVIFDADCGICLLVSQILVRLDGLKVIGTGVVDAVDRAGLQLNQALRAFGAPAEDQVLGNGRIAPVVIEAVIDDLIATPPLGHLVWAGAVGLLDQIAAAAGGFQVIRIVDGEG